MLLMAHHMVLFCGFHFKHEKTPKYLLKYYAPQTEARHTVDARSLLTLTQLKLLIRKFPYFKENKEMHKLIAEAAQLRGALDNELKVDHLLPTFI